MFLRKLTMSSLKSCSLSQRSILFLSLIFGSSLVQIFVFLRWSSHLQIQSENNVTALFIEIDYDAIYASFGEHETYKDKRLFNFSTFETYSSTSIASNGCRLTVSLTDPRLPPHGYNHPVWFALESMASYVPYACVVIHTASCQIIKQTSNIPTVPTKLQQIAGSAQSVYEKSLPLFRRMMENGRVRISILEKGKYNIESCDSWDISAVNLNVHFWKDEFIEGVDSNMILFMQSDAVLCRHFDIDLWADFAYLGGPWQPAVFINGGGCDEMRRIWQSYAPRCNVQNPDVSLPHLCTPGHGGLVGNGGLSIRNKQWMIKAIETCPTEYSGMGAYQQFGHQQEDVYFSTVLNGLQAPMPSAFEASLFAVESLFPEQTLQTFFPLAPEEILDTASRLWGNDTGKFIYERMHRSETYITKLNESDGIGSDMELRTVPIGFHQVTREKAILTLEECHKYGEDAHLKSWEEATRLEPRLKRLPIKPLFAVHRTQDKTESCEIFVKYLIDRCPEIGIEYQRDQNAKIVHLEVVRGNDNKNIFRLTSADGKRQDCGTTLLCTSSADFLVPRPA